MPKPSWIGTPRCGVPLAQRADPANQQICFTSTPPFLHPPSVRKSIAVCLCFVTTLSCAFAQDQEKKLVDRLLKPDMTLQNDAQSKKFIADGSSTNKRANVGTFYVQKKSTSKSFLAIGEFLAHPFTSHSYHSKRSVFEVSSEQPTGNSRVAYANQTARGVRDFPQSDKKIASSAYSQNRPFLDEGKSQKSLNRQNAPLTIEQVRELLNKNK
jgi:hypothetical protein